MTSEESCSGLAEWTKPQVRGGFCQCSVLGFTHEQQSHVDDHRHPVAEFACRLTGRLDGLAQVPLLSMTPAQKRAALVELARGEAQLAALRLRLLADAEQSEATVESGAATAADWVAVETRQVRREARSELRLAQRLDHHETLSAAMACGRVNLAQSRAIVAALDRLPRTGTFARSPPSSGPRPSSTWSTSPPTTTPKTSASWAAGSSR